jgi:hypothetical protein
MRGLARHAQLEEYCEVDLDTESLARDIISQATRTAKRVPDDARCPSR